MRLQSTQAACGPAAIANALRALDLAATEDKVAKWIDRVRRAEHPGVEGTGELNLARAVSERAPKAWRLTARSMTLNDPGDAIDALTGATERGCPVVLAVDPEEGPEGWGATHWVAVVGRLGNRFLVSDAADTELVVPLTPAQLLVRWEVPTKPRSYYGLVLSTEKT